MTEVASTPSARIVATIVSTAVEPTTVAVSGAFPICADLPVLEAPADWYRDRPVYVGEEPPVGRVRKWARGQPGYQEMWLDWDNFGWVTLAFTEDVEAREAELEAEFPDVGAVAVEVPTTKAELNGLQRRVHQLLVDAGIDFGGSGYDPTRWVVTVFVNAADPRLAAALAAVADERICLEDAGVPVPEGPQPVGGDGWRLVGDELVGDVYRTGIATDDEQYAALWSQAGMTAQRPAVDFTSEVVVWFGAVYGSSCPIRVDDVVVDIQHRPVLVYPLIVVPGGDDMCTDDANPHAYVVAIERGRLPVGAFATQLGPEDPPPGAPEERTLVNTDLSSPGAVATAEEIGPDPALIEASQQPEIFDSGEYLWSDPPWRYRLSVRCGIGVLGQLNGIWWMTGADTVAVPSEWTDLVDVTSESIIVEVNLNDEPDPTMTATANGHTVTYEPVRSDAVPACD
jgi:hypothetical protein